MAHPNKEWLLFLFVRFPTSSKLVAVSVSIIIVPVDGEGSVYWTRGGVSLTFDATVLNSKGLVGEYHIKPRVGVLEECRCGGERVVPITENASIVLAMQVDPPRRHHELTC